MEADFNENDTTRTSLGKVIKWIQLQERRRKQWIAVWAWFKKVLSFASAEGKGIRLDEDE